MNQQPACFGEAKWIWTEDTQTVNQYADFLALFTLPAEMQGEVRLYISADSEFVANVNGTVLDVHQYPDYPEYKVYEDIDITSLVKAGENRLEIVGYCQNEDSFTYRKNIPGLLFSVTYEGEPVCVSHAGTLCREAAEYDSGEMDRLTAQLSFSFSYRRRTPQTWRPATEVPRSVNLVPCPIRRLRVLPAKEASLTARGTYRETAGHTSWGDRMYTAWLLAQPMDHLPSLPSVSGIILSAQEGGDGVYAVVDLGSETVGYVTVDLQTAGPCEMLVGFGENLDDLRVRTNVGGRQFAASIHLDGGRQRITYRFKRWGCRYLQVHIAAPEATLFYAGLLPVEYPVTYRQELPLEDHLHQKIARVARRGLELCMHDHYEDCPWREQALYGLDSMIQMLCGYVVFDNPEFAASSLRLLGLGARESGLMEMCAPSRTPITIPCFALAWIMALRNYWQVTDDLTLIRDMRPVWEAVLEAFRRQVDEQGLVHRFAGSDHWNFYEWTEGMCGRLFEDEGSVCMDAPAQALYIMGLTAAEELATALGDEMVAHRYAAQRMGLIAAAQRFWDEVRQAYVTTIGPDVSPAYHELTQALMVCAGVPDEESTRLLCDKLTAPKENGLVEISLSCTLFKYMALLTDRARYEPYIWQSILDTWGPMVFNGATSFWETIGGSWDFEAAGSQCHGWSSVPLWVYSQL